MSEERLRELVAQAWCTKENEKKQMDPVLAETIVQSIKKELDSHGPV